MQTASSLKNIVLISFDDAVAFWHYKSVFGELLQTPNLDRICAQSTSFRAAYCQAPVCSPSRASFMSGKSPHQTGITGSNPHYFDRLPASEMWPARLKRKGYYCSSGGKVLRGLAALPNDVHRTVYSDQAKKFKIDQRKRKRVRGKVIDRLNRTAFGGFRGGEATIDAEDDRKLYDHQVAESAMEFFDSYDGAAPFYREVGFSGPHGPWLTPKRFKEMYDLSGFRMPEAWKVGFNNCPAMDEAAPPNFDIGQDLYWKKSVRNYFSSLSHADYQLGRVWDALKASPHAENTLIVIVSDHGMHLGERNRFRKHTLWEQVANVPLIVHDPIHPTAQIVNDPVALLDVGPTVMNYLDLPPLDNCLGRSLRSLAQGLSEPPRPIPTFYEDNAAIRYGQYRFIRYWDGTTQFFDLVDDWWQTRDLGIGHPEYDRMRALHAACCKEHGFDLGAPGAFEPPGTS